MVIGMILAIGGAIALADGRDPRGHGAFDHYCLTPDLSVVAWPESVNSRGGRTTSDSRGRLITSMVLAHC